MLAVLPYVEILYQWVWEGLVQQWHTLLGCRTKAVMMYMEEKGNIY